MHFTDLGHFETMQFNFLSVTKVLSITLELNRPERYWEWKLLINLGTRTIFEIISQSPMKGFILTYFCITIGTTKIFEDIFLASKWYGGQWMAQLLNNNWMVWQFRILGVCSLFVEEKCTVGVPCLLSDKDLKSQYLILSVRRPGNIWFW